MMRGLNLYRRLLFVVAGVVGLAGVVWADWSPEIVLWQPPDTSFFPGYMESCIKVDSQENVHIVHTFRFRHPQRPQTTFVGLRYVMLNNHGQILAEHMISDSADDGAGYQHLIFFGQDSLWVVWATVRSQIPPDRQGYAYRALDLDGNLLGPECMLQEDSAFAIGLAVDVRQSDRAVALAYPRQYVGMDSANIRVIVQLPNGERILDAAKVWSSLLCDRPSGFVDFTDSLQLAWREAYFDWNAVFTKRIATTMPFDSSLRSDHIALTPDETGHWHSDPNLQPLDSGRFLMLEIEGFTGPQNLHLLQRNGYSSLGVLQVEGDPSGTTDFGMEGDSVVGVPTLVPGNYTVHLLRYRFPDFQLLSDESLATRPSPFGAIACNGYTVSQTGERHILFHVMTSSNGGRLAYRYWRSDLSAIAPHTLVATPSFVVTPNPSYGSVVISGSVRQIREIQIYNLLGQLLESYSLSPQSREVDHVNLSLNTLPAGTYFLRIHADPHMAVQKIIILK